LISIARAKSATKMSSYAPALAAREKVHDSFVIRHSSFT
jgi:hypothetical protein